MSLIPISYKSEVYCKLLQSLIQNLTTMFSNSLVILFLLYNVLDTEGSPKFRADYTYSKRAEGWFKLHLIPATWSNAKILCKAEGATLASPVTSRIGEALVEYVAKESGRSVTKIFTGIHSTYSAGMYTSIEGVPLSKIPFTWSQGQPDNCMNSESCLTLDISSFNYGTVSDEKCSEVFPFVCYKKDTHIPNVISECGTIDTEYKLDNRTGKCYKFHKRGRTWPNAFMTCMAEGAHLAIINSEVEFESLRDLFNSIPDNMIFSTQTKYAAIGISDPNDGGSWVTIHGDTLVEAGFESWQPGEPNNATQPYGELCGVMNRGNGKYYDAACFWSLAFICEMEPDAANLIHALK